MSTIHSLRAKALLVLLFVFCLRSYGQDKGFVVGIISDTLGRPIELANISVENTNIGSSSDENGRYKIKVQGGKRVKIVYTCIGYVSKVIDAKIAENEKQVINVKLVASTSAIEEVSVISTRRRFGNIEKIGIKDIEFIPDASGNFESLLKSLPGVSSSNELSAQYSVRGGNFDENLIYVNGIEIYRPLLIRSGQQEGLSFINSDMVSGVEFSSGGFNAEYGDKMSSVLNVKYRTPKNNAENIGISLLGANITVEDISNDKKLTHITGFRYKTSQYLLNTLDVKGDYRPSFIDLQSNIVYRLNTKTTISFLGAYSSNKYQFAPDVRETRFGLFNNALQLKVYYEGQEVNRFETASGSATTEFKPLDNLQLKLIFSGFVTHEQETFDLLGEYLLNELDNSLGSSTYGDSLLNVGIGGFLNHARNYLDARVFAIENTNNWISGSNKLKLGFKYQRELIDDKISEWELIDSSGYSLPNSSDQIKLSSVLKASNSIQSNRLSGFIQDEYNFSGNNFNYITTVGARLSYWDYSREIIFSPRFAVTLDPNWSKDINFHISGGYYYQPPFYKELRLLNGTLNPSIKSQQSIQFVIGSEYSFSAWQRPFRFTSELYYKNLHNLIPYKVDNVRIRYSGLNQANGYAVGLDIKVNGELVPGAESWASLSIMQTREDISNDSYINSSGQKVYPSYYPRPTDQRVNFGIFFQDYLPGNPTFRVHLSGHFGTGLPVGIPKSDRYDLISRMPSYKRVDIGFSKIFKDDMSKGGSKLNNIKWIKGLWLSAEVFNLLNINNTISYLWVQTVKNQENSSGLYAVPNYLTSRRINLKVTVKF